MKLFFPDYALSCLHTIENNGFEAWFVGGAVRDAILDREFYDVDITTNALPEDIIRIFPRTVPTGIKHGTVTVILNGNPIEVTTYRSDSDYTDSRHPNSVKFEKNIEFDLSRRDFTINALAFHPDRGLLDLFGGLNDIKNKKIAAVGNPTKRFTEDSLRILRAFRFSSVLDFEIENETLCAAYNCAERIAFLSGERILSELKKLAEGKNPAVLEQLVNNGALKEFGILSATQNLNNVCRIKRKYKTAVFLSLCELNLDLLKNNLKPDNALFNTVALLKEIYLKEVPENKTDLKLLLSAIGKENAELYFEVIKFLFADNITTLLNSLFEEIEKNREPYTIKELMIRGNDLIGLGIRGEEIGRTLEILKREVIFDPSMNEKQKLLKLVNKIM